MYTWGSGNFGVLGHGDDLQRDAPTPVATLVGINVIEISCGDMHMAVLTGIASTCLSVFLLITCGSSCLFLVVYF